MNDLFPLPRAKNLAQSAKLSLPPNGRCKSNCKPQFKSPVHSNGAESHITKLSKAVGPVSCPPSKEPHRSTKIVIQTRRYFSPNG